MATIFNTGLYRTLGIQFEYKIKFQEFLNEAINDALIVTYDDAGNNTPASRTATVNSFVGCGPSMGFEAKKAAYNSLELICEALVNNADVPASDTTTINSQLLNVTRYVGMEGEEDFNFMVATFNLSETISRVIGEVVPAPQAPVGEIVTFTIVDGGSGYEDGVGGTSSTTTVTVDSSETTNPAGYTAGAGTVTFVAGVVTDLTLSDGGAGFAVGQIVQLNVSAGAQDTPALAIVVSVA